jgi:Na+/melibiose symporter-like transporter
MSATAPTEKLPFAEKLGYGAADAAANFVFMSMILFQTNFYTDVFKLSATTAAAILLWPRLWDAVADPIVGVLADRTNTRWGKFRPWILFTALPWLVIMIAAYTVPTGWETKSLILYAAITNTLLMTIYSMNNMPYAALGGVMTADVHERASLNSYRFVLVNVAQFLVGGLTLPLVAKFARAHNGTATGALTDADRAHGWHTTMTIWGVLCFVLFLVTFFTTKERIQPPARPASQNNDPAKAKSKLLWRLATVALFVLTGLVYWHFAGVPFRPFFSANGAAGLARMVMTALSLYSLWNALSDSVQQDFRDLVHNHPWWIMFFMTLAHFAILSGRGGAMYNYYQHYADKGAMFAWLESINLTTPGDGPIKSALSYLGYIVQADKSNVADVFNSIINMVNTGTTIVVILLSVGLAKKYGKKTVAVIGFALSTVVWTAFYLVGPTNTWGMFWMTVIGAIVYAPTIALVWAIYADVADYSEWKTGRRATGMVFATIGFALKSGLAIGSWGFLTIMVNFFSYDTAKPDAANAVQGFHVTGNLVVALLFATCTVLLAIYPLGKETTLSIAAELAERRKKLTAT